MIVIMSEGNFPLDLRAWRIYSSFQYFHLFILYEATFSFLILMLGGLEPYLQAIISSYKDVCIHISSQLHFVSCFLLARIMFPIFKCLC